MTQATLLLEGGAARGLFTSGVLDYLLEKDCMVTDVIGLSAGANNALGYVARQKGWAKDCMIREDESFKYCSLKSFVRNKSLIDMELLFDKLPNEMVPFDYEAYFSSDINTRMGVTNCVTGQVEFLSETSDKEELMRLCKASCSLPILAPIVDMDGVPYMDGGIADSVPVHYAQSVGNEKLVVILTRNPGYRKGNHSKSLSKLFARSYRQYPKFVKTLNTRFQRYNTNMDYLEELERKGQAFVIRPQVELCGRMEQNPKELSRLYNHGYEHMEQEYEKLEEYLMTS